MLSTIAILIIGGIILWLLAIICFLIARRCSIAIGIILIIISLARGIIMISRSPIVEISRWFIPLIGILPQLVIGMILIGIIQRHTD